MSPILSLLLVHDLLLAKRGIALPATHGLRTAIERHKGRLQAELTKARIRRKLGSIDSLKAHIESGQENTAGAVEAPYPRWVRANTLKTTLEEQLDTTFKGYERAKSVDSVRRRNAKQLYIDDNIPNLVAVSPCADLQKSEAYKSGSIIFQDKASCFPAYLLNPLTEDGGIIDTCSAPGNKTTHLAAILLGHSSEPDGCKQTIHAFEKDKGRAVTLEKMINLAGSNVWTKTHPGQDFLKTDPDSPAFKDVGALLLDPSCSGSGIVGRDDMPELHLPVLGNSAVSTSKASKKGGKTPSQDKETRKRKRDENENEDLLMIDDDGTITAVDTNDELKTRLTALSAFQFDLLLHAFKFPAARKITYSTCSIHAEENESVVQNALASDIARERGWRILKRDEQVAGLRKWSVRGAPEACGGDGALADACIRATKGDEHATMGFFLAGFVRDPRGPASLGEVEKEGETAPVQGTPDLEDAVEEDWNGFSDDEQVDALEEDKHSQNQEDKPSTSQPRKSGKRRKGKRI